MMDILQMIQFGGYALVTFAAFAGGTFGWTFATNYKKMAQEVAELKDKIELIEGREVSYRRMIDRRDAAIKASKCAAQIQDWVSNPDKIPKPFDPHNQSLGGTFGT
jgi:hypothetical protein